MIKDYHGGYIIASGMGDMLTLGILGAARYNLHGITK